MDFNGLECSGDARTLGEWGVRNSLVAMKKRSMRWQDANSRVPGQRRADKYNHQMVNPDDIW